MFNVTQAFPFDQFLPCDWRLVDLFCTVDLSGFPKYIAYLSDLCTFDANCIIKCPYCVIHATILSIIYMYDYVQCDIEWSILLQDNYSYTKSI